MNDYKLNNVWGGIPKVKYYAPDGTYAEHIPKYRTRRDGVVYDVLLAKGYSTTPPVNPKIHCNGCGQWHDTQEEVDACIKRNKAFIAKYEKIALKQHRPKEDKRIDELEQKIERLTKLLEVGEYGNKI